MSQLLFSLSYLVIFKLSFIESLIDCDNVLSDINEFTGECSNKWKNLKPLVRPGQAVVGYAWVRRKVDNHFGSEDDAQDYMDENPIIGVINPGIQTYRSLASKIVHCYSIFWPDFNANDDTQLARELIEHIK